MIIKARNLQVEHIGHAVRIPWQTNRYPFVLTAFYSLIWEPNPYTDGGQVSLQDRQMTRHTIGPDDEIEVEP